MVEFYRDPRACYFDHGLARSRATTLLLSLPSRPTPWINRRAIAGWKRPSRNRGDFVEQRLGALMPHLDRPVCYWGLGAHCRHQMRRRRSSFDVHALSRAQQRVLSSWLEQAASSTRVISTTSAPLCPSRVCRPLPGCVVLPPEHRTLSHRFSRAPLSTCRCASAPKTGTP